MLYSGILVVLRPESWDAGLEALGALEDVEVHHREAATHRVVLVVETSASEGQETALRRIREVPGVVVAEPVYHYRPEPGADVGESGTLSAEAGTREDPS